LHASVIALKPKILGACAKKDDISLGTLTPFISATPGV